MPRSGDYSFLRIFKGDGFPFVIEYNADKQLLKAENPVPAIAGTGFLLILLMSIYKPDPPASQGPPSSLPH